MIVYFMSCQLFVVKLKVNLMVQDMWLSFLGIFDNCLIPWAMTKHMLLSWVLLNWGRYFMVLHLRFLDDFMCRFSFIFELIVSNTIRAKVLFNQIFSFYVFCFLFILRVDKDNFHSWPKESIKKMITLAWPEVPQNSPD